MTDESSTLAPARSRWRRTPLRRTAVAALAVGLVSCVGVVGWVQLSEQGRIRAADDVPDTPVALVLGAGLRPDGSPSLFLTRRLEVARDLYDHGTVEAILVSGDSSRVGYDEPTAMRDWLVGHGVPAGDVERDYAGFDTHDTCVRAHEVFGIDEAVVVTQDYHLRRALFSCVHAGIDAVGVGASSASDDAWKFVRYRLREIPASVRAALDAVVGREPVFLGPAE